MSAADERDQGNTGPPVIDIAGVVMYVGPVDYDTYSPLCMREVALIDAAMRIIFLHIFEELVERHWNELLSAEANVGLIMATSMKVHQLSSVHDQVRDDLSFRDAIKNEVLLRKDARKQDDVDNSLVPKITATEVDFCSGQSSPVKQNFKYIRGDERPPINVNKKDQLD
ncbi:uncharacterized protein [Triticum aestivum]|uniref:uncharacterized protein isoform X1 n=1 Tax=Triticum aestivum TaxID=4565 RepID=UPI001D019537|nr:uncharacterized protein LOC123145578 isoform X1 [Triticum aestivum]